MERYDKYKDSGIDWIGEIPENWEIKRLRYLGNCQNGVSKGADYFGSGYPFVNYTDIYNNIELPQEVKGLAKSTDEDRISYSVEKGDIFFTRTSETVEEIGIASTCLQTIENAIFSGFLIRFRPFNSLLFTEFSKYYFRSYIRELFFVKEMNLVTRASLSQELLKKLPVLLPPLQEQKKIARFLDRKTAEINQLIAQKERLIELYEEEKTAIINQAVTKGINPDVKLKPSGIDWLGDIPEHWEIKKLKYVSKILRGKFTHRPRNDERLYGGKYPFIQTGEVTNAEKQIIGYRQTLNDKGFSVSQQFPKGTLLMTIAANIGDVAILDFDACFPDSIVGFFPKEIIFVDFLYYKFIALRNILLGLATQNTQQNLNIERISPVEISFPPLKEQKAIAEYIETECDRIDAKIAKTKRIIELQKEYRTALISEAVTGKIKVPQLP